MILLALLGRDNRLVDLDRWPFLRARTPSTDLRLLFLCAERVPRAYFVRIFYVLCEYCAAQYDELPMYCTRASLVGLWDSARVFLLFSMHIRSAIDDNMGESCTMDGRVQCNCLRTSQYLYSVVL